MRILLLGAGGFIGRHIVAELLRGGHEVVAVVRRAHGLDRAFPAVRFVEMDLAGAVQLADWGPLLHGVDLIVNAAGLLRGPAMEAVHVAMPRALHAAAVQAGVRRAVLISAISARGDVATDYARTKLAGEEALRQSGLNWTILRPSLVYGEGSYGGTSLMRGLAGLPFLLPIAGKGNFAFSPIHVQDLARTVRIVCEDECFAAQAIEPVGPNTIDLKGLLQRYRNWLGFGPAWTVPIPMPFMTLLGRLGDLLGDGPVSSNSLRQMVAGNAGDSTRFAAEIGFVPRSLDEALRDHPAQVQDRWHARLFFMAPAIKAVLILLWLASGLLGLFHGAADTDAFIAVAGLDPGLATPLRIGTSLLDFLLAGLVLIDRRARWSTVAQFAVVLGYTVVLGAVLPGLWSDPLGPLLKNLPVMLLILVHGAIGDHR
ncbi:MAG: SDR family oxidoreductase [Sphingobium sp.]|nr:SDR family oxidoreductase [Sphingobium sp.]